MNNTGEAYQRILKMAEDAGVSYERTPLDELGEAVTHLSDNALEHNDATRAIIAMSREGVISTAEGDALLLAVMEEMETT